MRYHDIHTRMAKIKKTEIPYVNEYMVQLEFSYNADGNKKCYNHFREQVIQQTQSWLLSHEKFLKNGIIHTIFQK